MGEEGVAVTHLQQRDRARVGGVRGQRGGDPLQPRLEEREEAIFEGEIEDHVELCAHAPEAVRREGPGG